MKEKREALEQILSRQLDWIVAAETRVGLLLPIETALLGGLLTVRLGSDACHGFEQFAAILGIGLLVAALGCLGVASWPRTKGPKGSRIFFGGIAEKSVESYVSAVSEISDAEYDEDLARQVHRNAQIATEKFWWIGKSVIALFLSLAPSLYGFAYLVENCRS